MWLVSNSTMVDKFLKCPKGDKFVEISIDKISKG